MSDNTNGKTPVRLVSGTRDAARRRGQTYFTSTEAREGAFRAEQERERKASDDKTAKLKALRLAKEEDDRLAAANAPPPTRKTRPKRIKPV
ncbi:MAG TPA: hypothetical protein VGG10_17225 [Rhizomicrobium sp.]